MTHEEVQSIVDPLNSGGEKPLGVLVLGICKSKCNEYIKVYISGHGLYENQHGEFVELMNAEDSAVIYE